jgi:hypothetical protein
LVNIRKLISVVQRHLRKRLKKRVVRLSLQLLTRTTCQYGIEKNVIRTLMESTAPEANMEADYEPLTPFTHTDHGKDADPTFPNLLKNAKVVDLTAGIGAEVNGVQLSQLTKEGKDELALFVAQKKVVGECRTSRCMDIAKIVKHSETRTLQASLSRKH